MIIILAMVLLHTLSVRTMREPKFPQNVSHKFLSPACRTNDPGRIIFAAELEHLA